MVSEIHSGHARAPLPFCAGRQSKDQLPHGAPVWDLAQMHVRRFRFRLSWGYSCLLILLIGLGTMAVVPFALAKDQATIEAPVSRIVDGDTFKLQGQTRSIRIWGLDAPERDMAGGPAATAALRQLISGETLRCVIHDIDRYRRFVGQCFLPDGRDIAAEMIATGRSSEYCRYSKGYYGTC